MGRAMPRFTPFHPRTSALCRSYAYKEWAGHVAVCTMDRHSEREYFAFRQGAGLLDVSPLHKVDVRGPDAAAFLSWVWTRDMRRLAVGQVVYACMCDERGRLLDDGTVARLSEQHYRATSSEPWMHWLHQQARGFQVELSDTSDSLCALAVQGPNARAVLAQVVAHDLDRLRFFRICRTTLAGRPVWVSRTGYTGDLGYEVFLDPVDALPVWDAIVAAGEGRGLEPVGLDALDVARIEAGFVLQGVDYVSAVRCVIPERMSTPAEAGLGWTVELDREPFVGQAALKAEAARGAAWGLVGLELDWAELDALYARHGLPPHLAPVASRSALPVYDDHGVQVGQVTSSTWSPTLKRSLALASVRVPFDQPGLRLRVEHTVEYVRHTVGATVVPRPFFDPPRKRATPGARAATPSEGRR
jgi:aminomethyltransferase